MRKYTYYLTIAIMFLSITSFGYSQATKGGSLDVPDFSFKGEEIASFAIRPSFRDVNLDINVVSEYAKYADEQTVALAKDTQYKADEPGFFYGFRPTTAIASIFVGDKAYRNYIVKAFFNNDYETVLKAYKNYDSSITTPNYKEESQLIYGMALLPSDPKAGEDVLYLACTKGEFFQGVSCDKYTQILWDKKRYSGIINAGEKIQGKMTKYTFSALVLSYFKRGEFAKADEVVKQNYDLIFDSPDFNDIRAIIEYYNSNYAGVLKLAPYTTNSVAFMKADSAINLNRFKEAEQYIAKLADGLNKGYLTAKLNIGKKNLSVAGKMLTSFSDEEKLDLLNFYVSTNFPDLSLSFVKLFQFKDTEKRSYPQYYTGLQKLQNKDYKGAVEAFSYVVRPQEIADMATYYKGIALVYIDPIKAEQDIINTMNNSSDPIQVSTARFMLAQTYYMKGNDSEALQLIDDCTTAYCEQLRGEINLRRGDYDIAVSSVGGLDTAQAKLVRATAFYNKKQYDLANKELDTVLTTTKDVSHLRMMLRFKEGKTAEAIKILQSNKEYMPILSDGIQELMLLGDYKLAATLLQDYQGLSPEMEINHAKLLAWEGKKDAAKALYNKQIGAGVLLFESYSGLVALEKTAKDEYGAIVAVINSMDSKGHFPQKDLLLSKLAEKIARLNDNVLLIRVINGFFPKYEASPYAADMYTVRAKLFLTTGRSNECLQDISNAVERDKSLDQGLLFLKAQCTEGVDKKGALNMYKKMFASDEQFRLPSAVRIMDISTDANEILGIAQKVKPDSQQLYIEGVRRYVETATVKILQANSKFVDSLMADKSKPLKCAGLFAKARLLNDSGKGMDAAAMYYKIYETDKSDHFTLAALDVATSIYTQLKMPEDAKKVRDIKAKLK